MAHLRPLPELIVLEMRYRCRHRRYLGITLASGGPRVAGNLDDPDPTFHVRAIIALSAREGLM